MLPRFTLAARIGVTVLVSLTVVWLVVIALFYLQRAQGEGGGLRPSPDRLAAMVQLIEETPSDQQPLVLRAVHTETLDARLEPGIDVSPAFPPRLPLLVAPKVHAYRAALDGRPMSLTARGGRMFPRVPRLAYNALEFRIGLRTGQTLVVDTVGAYPLGWMGLPRGLGAGLVGTLIALAALFIMNRETRPLTQLAAAVDRIELAGAPAPLPDASRSAPEIRALVDAFARLQNRLLEVLKARMAMLGGISHDVRTFATRLRLRVDLIPEGPDRDRAVADIADMIRLLDDALLASRAGAGELAEELVELDVLVREETADRRAQGADVALSAPPAQALVLGDRLALRRIIGNLIDNALKYGGQARIALESDSEFAALIVDDDGPGIPPDQRQALLEPFVRLEGSRNRRTGGAGLGLSIVRNLAEALGGSVSIGDAPGRGARIAVRLPLFTL